MTSRVPHFRRRFVAALATATLVVGACASDDPDDASAGATTGTEVSGTDAPEATDAPDSGGGANSFSVSISEPAAIDPALSQEVEGAQVTRLLFTTLTTLDAELDLQPGVASAWSLADDGVTWTFELDPASTFSDGSTVDAADFVYAFARAADPDLAAPASYQGSQIVGWDDVMLGDASGAVGDVEVSGVTALDEHTLQIETIAPFSLLPMLMTYPVFAPVPSEMAGDADAEAAFAEQPIGNGPYLMTEPWQHNESITLLHFDASALTASDFVFL